MLKQPCIPYNKPHLAVMHYLFFILLDSICCFTIEFCVSIPDDCWFAFFLSYNFFIWF